MRIAFLCGGLEPGRDGVGDYTRLLAGENVRQGHECILIALNDRQAKRVMTDPPPAGSGEIPTLRLPSSRPWRERSELATRELEAFKPDWVSLQFVCYAFHPKGLTHGLADRLRPLVSGRKLQVMFHELWIGDSRSASLLHRVVGALQRRSILQMVRLLSPAVIHTSTPVYIAMLAQQGIRAAPLPLFGNIPIVSNDGRGDFPAEFLAGKISGDRGAWWIAVLFGTLHPEWSPEPLFALLRKAARGANRRIGLVSVGRLGGAGELLWEKMQRDYEGELVLVKLGEQSAPSISHLLQMADFGIATSPLQLIGKSGSAAAMLEHGLPVIANRDDWHTRRPTTESPTNDPLVQALDGDLEAKLIRGFPRRTPEARLPALAAQFIRDLRSTYA